MFHNELREQTNYLISLNFLSALVKQKSKKKFSFLVIFFVYFKSPSLELSKSKNDEKKGRQKQSKTFGHQP